MTVAELRALFQRGQEFAFFDVREEGAFGKGHLLLAASLTLSNLEAQAWDRVPRRDVPIVICDGGEGALAARAAGMLSRIGYGQLSILEGGVSAWAQAGHEVFKGFNVVSKAFGEWIEHQYDTPSISAEELHALQGAQGKLVLLDCRPRLEHLRVHVPGAIHCPGIELVNRVPPLITDAEALVVVHCAGRTRSIVGAQTLRAMGVTNPVVALRNGTMGWELAGFQTTSGGAGELPPVDVAQLGAAADSAVSLRTRFAISELSDVDLQAWAGDTTRTLYQFDVRTVQEYEAGHRPGFIHAPGGQLLQQLDEYAPVRGARIVLADDNGLRATMTAAWLKQMGCREVAITGMSEQVTVSGARTPTRPRAPTPAATVQPDELATLLEQGIATVIDLSRSTDYAKAHIPGAWFGVRSRLGTVISGLPVHQKIVLTCPDGELSAWALQDLSLQGGKVSVLSGGNAGWVAQGRRLVDSDPHWADVIDDVYVLPYDYVGDIATQMQAYIDWELELVAQLQRDGFVAFGYPAPSAGPLPPPTPEPPGV